MSWSLSPRLGSSGRARPISFLWLPSLAAFLSHPLSGYLIMSLFYRIFGRILGRGSPASPTATGASSGPRTAPVFSHPRSYGPVIRGTPGRPPSSAERVETGQYGSAYPAGERTNARQGEAVNRDQIPDRQTFTIYYSTYVRSFTWERYRGSQVVGRGEGTITIEFVSGAVCEYRGCSYSLFKDFIVSPSKGQFVNTFFRPKPYTLIRQGTTRGGPRQPLISRKLYPAGGTGRASPGRLSSHTRSR